MLPDLLDYKVQVEPLVHREIPGVQLVHKGLLVQLVQLVQYRVLPERLEQGLLAPLVQLDFAVPLGRKVSLVHQDHLGPQGQMVTLDLKDLKESLAVLAQPDLKVLQELLVLPVDQPEPPDRQVP